MTQLRDSIGAAGPVLVVLLALALGWLLVAWRRRRRRAEPSRAGCCPSCTGSGISGDDAVPGGLCWDCRGTGHPHAPPCGAAGSAQLVGLLAAVAVLVLLILAAAA